MARLLTIRGRPTVAIIALRDDLDIRKVNAPNVPDDYSSYPPYIDGEGRRWEHTDPQAFLPPDRVIPVYDLIRSE